MNKNNIVLIGMPGAGKSTVGVILAKTLKKPFLDTDLLIQQNENRLLQEIINSDGISRFLEIEESSIMGLNVINTVIATGGSAVYSERAISHLKETGIIVYLHLGYREIEKRIRNITTRGIAMNPGQKLSDLYNERVPLYKKYAEITVNCSPLNTEGIVEEIKSKLDFLS